MLPKKHRLIKERDFKQVFRKGRYFSNRIITLKLARNNLDFSRFGFIANLEISKKATLRNRVKRRLRESVRARLDRIRPGFDIVIIARPGIVDKNYQEVDLEIERLLRRAGVL